MMNRSCLITLLAAGSVAVTVFAQTRMVDHTGSDDAGQRSFAVVENSSMRFSRESVGTSAVLYRYVHDHPEGDYVVFVQNGSVYRMDGAARMTEVKQLYAPMAELSARQEALAHAQEGLARQQERLAK